MDKANIKKGVLLLLLGETFFASATLFAKFLHTGEAEISGIQVTFFRFVVGIFFGYFLVMREGGNFKPNNVRLMFSRAALNLIAVNLFFLSVQFSTITNANMLNMTYPVFIFFLAPFFLKEQRIKNSVWFLLAAMVGIYLVVSPDFSHINHGDVYGLLSGIIGAFAIMVLSKARKYDSTALIIFYLMTSGFIVNGLMVIPIWVQPVGMEWFWLIASGLFGVLGQAVMTSGYLHVTAQVGSMISSSRIVLAALLGVIFLGEFLAPTTIIGGSLIAIAIVGVNWLKTKESSIPNP